MFYFNKIIYHSRYLFASIPVAEQSKTRVCGFETRRRNGYLSLVSFVYIVRYRSLRLADHSSRGVLPPVECLNKCNLYLRRSGPTRAVELREEETCSVAVTHSSVLLSSKLCRFCGKIFDLWNQARFIT
jgi:hypothetical protein